MSLAKKCTEICEDIVDCSVCKDEACEEVCEEIEDRCLSICIDVLEE
ncbi:MAG: hypothetical protein QW775_00350 [Ignisphaera sp.]